MIRSVRLSFDRLIGWLVGLSVIMSLSEHLFGDHSKRSKKPDISIFLDFSTNLCVAVLLCVKPGNQVMSFFCSYFDYQ